MAGELIAQLDPLAWYRETSLGYDPRAYSAPRGLIRGMSFQKLIQAQLIEYYNAIVCIPASITMGTGVTLQFRVVDDGTNANDLGTVCQFGVTVFNVDSATFQTDFSASGTGGLEQTANVTLSATAGHPVTGSIAIATAQMASAAVANFIALRFRRIGDNAADTCQGRVIVVGAHLKNT